MSNLPFRPADDVLRSIPGLRVVGVEEGSPAAAVLANHFAGPLRQFYNAQAHNAELSGLEQWAKFVDRGDYQMRYLRQNGSETVTLTVHPQVAHKVLKESKSARPWDWAIIDFESDFLKDGIWSYEAADGFDAPSREIQGGFVTGLRDVVLVRVPLPDDTPWPSEGSASDTYYSPEMVSYSNHSVSDDTLHPEMMFAGHGYNGATADDPPNPYPLPAEYMNGVPSRWLQQELTSGRGGMSLRVDLRRRDYNLEVVMFEVYAELEHDQGNIYWYVEADKHEAVVIAGWAGGDVTIWIGIPGAGGFSIIVPTTPGNLILHNCLYGEEEFLLQYPEYASGWQILSTDALGSGAPSTGDWRDEPGALVLNVNGHYYETVYENPPRPFKVKYAMFRGTPPWEIVLEGKPQTYDAFYVIDYQIWMSYWAIAGQWPRFQMGYANRSTLVYEAFDFLESRQKVNIDGNRFMGLLAISPKHGWVSFAPVDA